MEFLQSYKNEIDTAMADFFDNYLCGNFSDSERKLFEGCKYAVVQGGKRIRPILGLMVYDAFAKKKEGRAVVIQCLVSLELIHAYSLIHDDLPAMDNDTLRRGQSTVWKKYGEAEAILIGDILSTMAFENLADNSPDFCIKELIKVLSQNAGINGMGGGQMRDIDSESKDISLEELLQMHSQKTGALLVVSAQFGAILTQASDSHCAKITTYAEKIGLAFQIKDDLLDAEGDEETVGKKVGKDDNAKGFVNLMGLDESKTQLRGLINEAVEIAEEFKSAELVKLSRFVGERDR